MRLAAGQYRIQIGEGIDGVTIDDGAIVLRRGEQVVANLTATDLDADLSNPDILIAMPAELIAAVEGDTRSDAKRTRTQRQSGWPMGRPTRPHRDVRRTPLRCGWHRLELPMIAKHSDSQHRCMAQTIERWLSKSHSASRRTIRGNSVHLDVEPPDSAARDRESFRRTRPNAREHIVELAELQPDDFLQQARIANGESAELTSKELSGKWRVASVTGNGRGAVGDEPIGEFVEFGAHTMTTFRDERRANSSVLGYILDQGGKIRLQVFRSGKLAESFLDELNVDGTVWIWRSISGYPAVNFLSLLTLTKWKPASSTFTSFENLRRRLNGSTLKNANRCTSD